ncbi:PREDICTED: phospholipid phosphatase 6 [Prunus dulcis]|uniref:PREDICTED: phospholipid phosphatase 6 n=1 Tax=Prunus dulcis TaxID=3755 RepID=A0A5E4FZA7_PRUDU|nr:probable lipid phosphate phosphatase beta [Prunus dulcis]VVA32817.1 PREDICTED: phospholipid phosphatase 6 [Prunus dulcis]
MTDTTAMEPSPPPKSKSTTKQPPPPPPPRPPLHRRLVTLDTTLSQRLHVLAKPFLPHFILLLLEISADFRFFFPLSLSLLLAPTLTLIPSPIQIPGRGASLSPIQILRPLLSPLILGLLLDLALIGLIKLLFRRARPLYNKNMNVAVSVDHFSFPSGHASRVCFVAALLHLSAAALADALALLRPTSPFIDRWFGSDPVSAISVLVLVAWTWAYATSFSRIVLGRHFVTDVCAGACLGMFEGLVAFRFLRF